MAAAISADGELTGRRPRHGVEPFPHDGFSGNDQCAFRDCEVGPCLGGVVELIAVVDYSQPESGVGEEWTQQFLLVPLGGAVEVVIMLAGQVRRKLAGREGVFGEPTESGMRLGLIGLSGNYANEELAAFGKADGFVGYDCRAVEVSLDGDHAASITL